MIKEIFCDLDGTLYNEKITERDLGAIRLAQEFGINFNIATGRVFYHAKDIIKQADINGDIICENGSYIYNNKGDCIFRSTLADSDIKRIISAYRGLKYIDEEDVLYFKYAGEVVIPKNGDLESYFSNGYIVDETILSRESYESKVGNIGIFSNDHQKLERIVSDLRGVFANEFDIYISGPVTMNIVPKGVSKFDAIKLLCKKNNISLDEVVTIGDSQNDISMLKNIKVSFAMDTAKDDVKSQAAYLTPTVADAVKMVIDYNQMNEE